MNPTCPQRAPTLYAIVGFKLLKGFLLLALALGVYRLAGDDLPALYDQALRLIRLDPEKEFFVQLAHKVSTITPANIRWVAVGTGLYSLFSLVEGFGLILRVSWAGWLAIGESLFFIPIEIRKLHHAYSTTVLIILILNIFIFCYLFRNRHRLFRHHLRHPRSPQTTAKPKVPVAVDTAPLA
ncbi:MAG: DUF2127 domain-containing protein [Verrucomicrobia bacterium]|nr:DUF2127 domain-containing protein [Verrucomicrobiota bacterium]